MRASKPDRIPVKTRFSAADRARLAALAGIGEPYLYQCLTNRRDMNPGEARRIEVVTAGEISRRDLCQTTWHDIWPELHVSQSDEQASRTQTPG